MSVGLYTLKRGVMRTRSSSMIEWPGVQVFLDRYQTGYEGEGWIMIGPLSIRLNFYGPLRSAFIQVSWRWRSA